MPNYDNNAPESLVTVLYVGGTQDHVSVFRELFEDNADSHFRYQVEHCDAVDEMDPHLQGGPAVILLCGTLSEHDKLLVCNGYGHDSDNPIPIIVLGPDLGKRELIDYYDLGITDYLVEPFSLNELFAKVHQYLSKLQASESATELLENRYEPQRLLGEGGFGSVYLALDHSKRTPTTVALKMYHADAQDTSFKARFLQEASQLSRVNHPNIVRLLDFGKTGNDYFLVTEFVDGNTLESVHAEHGILSEYQAALVGYYVGSAINHMSHSSIVHRDLSPRNIMLTHDGDVKVIDFGLAKTHMAATLNTDDQFQGTPYFIAPEYILGEEVSSAADLYSLAVTIYFMLTGNFPLDGENAHEVIDAHLNDIPRPLLDYIPDLTPEFSEMIALALSKDPAERPHLPDFILVVKSIIDAYAESSGGEEEYVEASEEGEELEEEEEAS